MVSLIDISEITSSAESDHELGLMRRFLWEEPGEGQIGDTIYAYADILKAIHSDNETAFKKCLEKLESRRITEEATWCFDDSLVFLLLLGTKKFKTGSNLTAEILKVRASAASGNHVDQTFNDLVADSYEIELPCDFVKVVFLKLLDGRTISREAAAKCFHFLIAPGFIESLGPFLQLVAIRAYELIMFTRAPKEYETFEDLISALEKHKSKLGLRQLFTILKTLPYTWVIGAIALVVAIAPWLLNHIDPIVEFWSKTLSSS